MEAGIRSLSHFPSLGVSVAIERVYKVEAVLLLSVNMVQQAVVTSATIGD
jgi:hypothetical protein